MPSSTRKNSDLFGVNILSRYSKKSELLSYLDDLHKTLSDLSQDQNDQPKGLTLTAKQLVSSKLLDHVDKDVRLLVACCIVDILRVYAPEAPYKDEDTVKAFELIVTQLKSLPNCEEDSVSALNSRVLYILHSLATVKSCVVPVLLAQGGVDGAEELVVTLFNVILSSVRSTHSEEGIIVLIYLILFVYLFVTTL